MVKERGSSTHPNCPHKTNGHRAQQQPSKLTPTTSGERAQQQPSELTPTTSGERVQQLTKLAFHKKTTTTSVSTSILARAKYSISLQVFSNTLFLSDQAVVQTVQPYQINLFINYLKQNRGRKKTTSPLHPVTFPDWDREFIASGQAGQPNRTKHHSMPYSGIFLIDQHFIISLHPITPSLDFHWLLVVCSRSIICTHNSPWNSSTISSLQQH